jgi:hypothetical protein
MSVFKSIASHAPTAELPMNQWFCSYSDGEEIMQSAVYTEKVSHVASSDRLRRGEFQETI